jgi:CHASE2 domain-containing sensor protein/tRNA A-37 threonylcarbamoyl transferase component Bud32
MSYCINPKCLNRYNADDLERCLSCSSSLVINERYRLIKPLRKLNQQHSTEIFEIDNLGTIKVIKILTSKRQRLIELFEQEAELLQKFQNQHIPRVYAYFVFSLDNGQKLRCLVMEKIIGQNLQDWIEQNNPLVEALAIDWLRQLARILTQVHQATILHRDIKPSNIMLCPDGQLKLIDFGAARKITNTYVDKLEEGDITRVYSSGYTAPEQVSGKAGYQSDFFALGRTFVHLLTGICPDNLPENTQTKKLIWRDQASQVSSWFADLIDELMEPSLELRLHKSRFILEQLATHENIRKVESTVKQNSANNTKILIPTYSYPGFLSYFKLIFFRGFHKVFALSLMIAFLIIGIRYLGFIQPLELQAFDHLMALRPLEMKDQRLLIVTVDEQDIQYQNQMMMPMRWSLSDVAFLQLLQKLEQYQPRTIGLDIYRDFAVNPQYSELAKRLREDQRLFALCKVPSPQDGDQNGTSPPPEVSQSRLGFSDFVSDDIEIIRRHILHLTPSVTSPCAAEYAFNFQLAAHYLHHEGFQVKVTSKGELKIGNVVLHRLTNHTSGYQKVDATGYQILLNYRSLRSPVDIAEQVSLRDILNDQINPELARQIKDSIVIIGDIAASGKDSWATPYSNQATFAEKQVPGVSLQANMVSQILSAVLDQRPLLWWWPTWVESLWILLWSMIGGIIVWWLRSPVYLGLATLSVILLLFTYCFGMLVQALWIPLIPSLLALTITQVAVLLVMRSHYLTKN